MWKSNFWNLLIFWLIIYPFIYGFLLSRLFGLKQKIDHWILFCLHIAVTPYIVLLSSVIAAYTGYDATMYLFALVQLTAVEGLVWQFWLKDRRFNGFYISFLCNLIFVIPPVLLGFMMWGTKMLTR